MAGYGASDTPVETGGYGPNDSLVDDSGNPVAKPGILSTVGTKVSDAARATGMGAIGLGQMATNLAYAGSGSTALKSAADYLGEKSRELESGLSPEMKAGQQKKFFNDVDFTKGEDGTSSYQNIPGNIAKSVKDGSLFGSAWSDPNSYLFQIYNQAGSALPMVGVGRIVGLGAEAIAGVSKLKPAIEAATVASKTAYDGALAGGAEKLAAAQTAKSAAQSTFSDEAAKIGVKNASLDHTLATISKANVGGQIVAGTYLHGSDAANAAMESITPMSHDQLMNSPKYAEAYQRRINSGEPEDQAQADAKEDIRRKAGLEAAAVTGTMALPFQYIIGKVNAKLFTGGMGSTSRLGNFGRAIAQEVIANPAELGAVAFGGNVGVQQYADPTRPLGQDVANTMAQAAIGTIGIAVPHLGVHPSVSAGDSTLPVAPPVVASTPAVTPIEAAEQEKRRDTNQPESVSDISQPTGEPFAAQPEQVPAQAAPAPSPQAPAEELATAGPGVTPEDIARVESEHVQAAKDQSGSGPLGTATAAALDSGAVDPLQVTHPELVEQIQQEQAAAPAQPEFPNASVLIDLAQQSRQLGDDAYAKQLEAQANKKTSDGYVRIARQIIAGKEKEQLRGQPAKVATASVQGAGDNAQAGEGTVPGAAGVGQGRSDAPAQSARSGGTAAPVGTADKSDAALNTHPAVKQREVITQAQVDAMTPEQYRAYRQKLLADSVADMRSAQQEARKKQASERHKQAQAFPVGSEMDARPQSGERWVKIGENAWRNVDNANYARTISDDDVAKGFNVPFKKPAATAQTEPETPAKASAPAPAAAAPVQQADKAAPSAQEWTDAKSKAKQRWESMDRGQRSFYSEQIGYGGATFGKGKNKKTIAMLNWNELPDDAVRVMAMRNLNSDQAPALTPQDALKEKIKAMNGEAKGAKTVDPAADTPTPAKAVQPEQPASEAKKQEESEDDDTENADEDVAYLLTRFKSGNFKVLGTEHILSKEGKEKAAKKYAKAYAAAAKQFVESDMTAPRPIKRNDSLLDLKMVEGASPKPISRNVKKVSTLEGAITALHGIAADGDIRYYLNGVHVEGDTLVATDNHREAAVSGINTKGIPDKTEKEKGFTILNRYFGKKKGTSRADPTVRWIDGKFPDWRSVMPERHGEKIAIGTIATGDYARGVAETAKYTSGGPFGDSYASLPIAIDGKTRTFNARYISDAMDLFRAFGYETADASFQDAGTIEGSIYLTSPDEKVRQVVLPMRGELDTFVPVDASFGPGKVGAAPKVEKRQRSETAPEQKAPDSDEGEVAWRANEKKAAQLDEADQWIAAYAKVRKLGAGDVDKAWTEHVLQTRIPDVSEAEFRRLYENRFPAQKAPDSAEQPTASTEAPATQEAKEPWEMTLAEYESQFGTPRKGATSYSGNTQHKNAVAAAVNQGKHVPAEVLSDYPELKPATATIAETAPEARKIKEFNDVVGAANWINKNVSDDQLPNTGVGEIKLSDERATGKVVSGRMTDTIDPAEIKTVFRTNDGRLVYVQSSADTNTSSIVEISREEAKKAGATDEEILQAVGAKPAEAEKPAPTKGKISDGRARGMEEAKPSPEAKKIAIRFRLQADGLEKQINDRRREMTQNATPKRMKEYRSRLLEGDNLERLQRAYRALADAHENGAIPKELAGLRTKDEIGSLVAKHNVATGYYDVVPSNDYSKTTPAALALQDMIEGKTPEATAEKEEKARLSQISQLEAQVQFQPIPGFFATPKPIITKMLDAADISPGDSVLEPSAGKGDIADAIKASVPDAKIDTVEQNQSLRKILELKGYNLAGDDFLEQAGKYDKIVMNPPFEKGADIAHVQHAYDLLNPGGRLVAIMSEGSFSNSAKKFQEFRNWLETHNGTSEKVESGAFQGKEAFRQTGVATRMVVVDKPEQSGGMLSRQGDTITVDGKERSRLNSDDALKVQSAIEGKTPIEAAKFIADTGTPAQATVARKVYAKLVTLKAAGIKLDLRITHPGMGAPIEMNTSRGYTEGTDKSITVWLHGAEMTGRVGTDYETLLHELVHAATAGAIREGMRNPGSAIGKTAQDLLSVTNAISDHITQRFTDAANGKAELTEFEKDMRAGTNNAFRSGDEVVAWSLSSREAQDYLDAIPYKSGTLWTRFVRAVRSLLGLAHEAETALSEVLRVSEELIDHRGSDMPYRDFASPSRKMTVQQVSEKKWGLPRVSGLDSARDHLESLKTSRLMDGVKAAWDGWLRATRPEDRTPGALEFARELREGQGNNEARSIKFMSAIGKSVTEDRQSMTATQKARDLLQRSLTAAADRLFVGKKEESYAFMQSMDSDDKSFLAARPGYGKMADVIRDMWSELAQVVQELDTGALQNIRENYFRHMWKQDISEEKMKEIYSALSKGPKFEGKAGFKKARVYQDFDAGIEAGLTPISDNPLDIVSLSLQEMQKYILAHTVLRENEAKQDGSTLLIGAADKTPPGYVDVNGRYGFITRTKEPGLKIKDKDGVATITSPANQQETESLRYVVRDAEAQVLNNYLSPSLYHNKYVGSLFTAYMKAANMLNMAQLGISAFHAGFTSFEAVINHGALGFKALSQGDIKGAGKYFASAPAAWITNPKSGGAVLEELLAPGTHKYLPGTTLEMSRIIEGLKMAGFKWQMDHRFRTDSTKEAMGAWGEKKYGKAALHSIPAVFEQASRPILEWLVPRQKFGVFAEKYNRWIETHPDATHEELRNSAQQIWNRVDATLGQVVYDRLFMHNVAKNFMQMLIRAPGWTGGTIIDVGGGFKDLANYARMTAMGKRPKELSDRAAYTLSMLATTAIANAILTALFTQKQPDDWKDLVAFRTGNLDENGREERFMLPTYAKDVAAYWNAPGTTLLHKSHPLIGLIGDATRNRDYYGTEIRSEDSNIFTQMAQTAGFTAKAFIPFWVKGMQKEVERGGNALSLAAPMIGVMPAPSYMDKTSAEKLMSKYGADQMPQGTKTEEKMEMENARRAIYASLRRGDKDKARQLYEQAHEDHLLTPHDYLNVLKQSRNDPAINAFKRLTFDQQTRVMDVANTEERAKFNRIYQVAGFKNKIKQRQLGIEP